jgi:hypothetical protein
VHRASKDRKGWAGCCALRSFLCSILTTRCTQENHPTRLHYCNVFYTCSISLSSLFTFRDEVAVSGVVLSKGEHSLRCSFVWFYKLLLFFPIDVVVLMTKLAIVCAYSMLSCSSGPRWLAECARGAGFSLQPPETLTRVRWVQQQQQHSFGRATPQLLFLYQNRR